MTDEVMHRTSGFYADGMAEESDGEDENEGDVVPLTPQQGGRASHLPSDRTLGGSSGGGGPSALAASPAAQQQPSLFRPLDPSLRDKLAEAGRSASQAAAEAWPEVSLAGAPFG